ncbi:MAG TPA: YbaL family putative K(+) efflux transporter [Xanthomonadales bacterium]|nr:YbaL family putative K(+) efflux transporter [Xanthomonadales bacterium]
MAHNVPLIATIAAAFGAALLLGFVAVRLRLPAIVGYLLAGVLIGPYTPGLVADSALAGELAEIGVMLLMFGVGLHFSLSDLLSVKRIALPGAILQIVVATALGALVAHAWGWSWGGAIVFGLSLSVASTVVLLRALESRGLLASMNGRIAVGWLVVEDLAMVLALVLLPSIAGALEGGAQSGSDIALALGKTLLKVGAFIALMLVAGARLLPRLLAQVSHTGSRELFTLTVIAFAVGIAFVAAKLFGVSFALGAFFAGMVLRGSEFSHRAAEESLPLRDAFAVLFFVSVGMLFDPGVLVREPLAVAAVVAIIVFGKSVAAAVVVLLLRYPLNTALTVSASLAQIGEFSFMLAGMGVALGVMPAEGRSLVLAGALISIAINPLVFAGVDPLLRWARARSAYARKLDARTDPTAELPQSTDPRFLSGHVVLVGHGRVGKRIARSLTAAGLPVVVVEQNRERVEQLREQGYAAVSGDAAEPITLVQAHVARARWLVIAIPDTFDVARMLANARELNPGIGMVVRSHSEGEAELLSRTHGARVFLGEAEVAGGMTRFVVEQQSH